MNPRPRVRRHRHRYDGIAFEPEWEEPMYTKPVAVCKCGKEKP